MSKKVALWLGCLGLSFLVESIGWAEQGKAFLFINLVAVSLSIAILTLIQIFEGDGLLERIGVSVKSAVAYGAVITIILFATWGATKLFNVDFYVAFQIMAFGQCLCS